MTALNACLTVARLAEAAGDSVPYLENVAKIAVLVFELLEVRFNIFGCMDFVAYVLHSKKERIRRMQRRSVRASRTRSLSLIPSFACKESMELPFL